MIIMYSLPLPPPPKVRDGDGGHRSVQHDSLYAHYLLNQTMDIHQTCVDISVRRAGKKADNILGTLAPFSKSQENLNLNLMHWHDSFLYV